MAVMGGDVAMAMQLVRSTEAAQSALASGAFFVFGLRRKEREDLRLREVSGAAVKRLVDLMHLASDGKRSGASRFSAST